MGPLDRRKLLTALSFLGAGSLVGGGYLLNDLLRDDFELPTGDELDPVRDEGALPPRAGADSGVGHLHKIKNFDREYPDDFFVAEHQLDVLRSTAEKLSSAQALVGHGNFNLLSFDELLRFARNYSQVGSFTLRELDFLEEIFHADAERYGFFGNKVVTGLTAGINERDVVKISGTGHFLLRGEPYAKYLQIQRDLGDSIFLTSGIRGVVKQFQLFLAKAMKAKGNLSRASRSLAPPGYSYHAIGDFDLGKVGYGMKNFTASFADTREYKKLIDLGYVAIRYTEENPFGVRHEPWHIKIG